MSYELHIPTYPEPTIDELVGEVMALKEERDRLREAVTRASAELRHAWKGMKRIVGKEDASE